MQPTAILSLLATMAAMASTAPSSLSSRQGAPRIRAGFHGEGGCGNNRMNPNLEDMIFLQNTITGRVGCRDLDVGPFPATYFNESSLTQTIRFYNIPCSQIPANLQGGNFIDIKRSDGSTPGCRSLSIRSYLTCKDLDCTGES